VVRVGHPDHCPRLVSCTPPSARTLDGRRADTQLARAVARPSSACNRDRLASRPVLRFAAAPSDWISGDPVRTSSPISPPPPPSTRRNRHRSRPHHRRLHDSPLPFAIPPSGSREFTVRAALPTDKIFVQNLLRLPLYFANQSSTPRHPAAISQSALRPRPPPSTSQIYLSNTNTSVSSASPARSKSRLPAQLAHRLCQRPIKVSQSSQAPKIVPRLSSKLHESS